MAGASRFSLGGWILLGAAISAAPASDDLAGELTFEKHVRPILKTHCFHCHGEEGHTKGGLDLRLRRLIVQGGMSGPAIEPGKPEASRLVERLFKKEMPPAEVEIRPTHADIELIGRWVAQGAKTARDEPESIDELPTFTEEERGFWAFQPVRRPSVPQVGPDYAVRTPLDAFLASKLSEKGLAFSPQADRRTLIRRATYSLHGLPPTPEQVEAFLADTRPDAYEKLIDRLLASPEYGQRWARHWLDVAGYAETDYNIERESARPDAFRYRDYVVDSLNADKPFDRFIAEQLAGDELAARPLNPGDPRTTELMTATGFLRMAPDATETSDTLVDRNQAVAEVIKVVASSLLGLTVGCAQCHDHRYDPILQEDYYRLRAIFDPAFDLKRWKKPSERLFDATAADVKKEAERIDAVVQEQQEDLRRRMEEHGRSILEEKIAAVPEEERDLAREAVETPKSERTEEQTALLRKYPMVRDVRVILGVLVEYDREADERFRKERREISQLRATRPPLHQIMAVSEPTGERPVSRLFYRGDPEQPKQEVEPGALQILTQDPLEPVLELPEQNDSTSGRRLAYARWLTGGSHPLVARVIVNRVWMHHFGTGLVGTPADFGFAGDRPSHPELLDWLADEFVRSGWQLKALHKRIMTSTAYRQLSRRTPELEQMDPDNRLLARMNVRRLDAESLRDSLLAATGELNRSVGGPSVPVREDSEGRVVIGQPRRRRGGGESGAGLASAALRRSLYIQVKRKLPLTMLEAFDLPAMTPNCDARRSSTVATQSLMFLNDNEIVERAQRLADRLQRERPGEPAAQVQRAFSLLFAAAPTAEELSACLGFLDSQTQYFSEHPPEAEGTADPHWQALAGLCQTLLCTNRFLYID